MVQASDLNPFSGLSFGSMGNVWSIVLLFVIALVVLALLGFLLFLYTDRKKFWIRIPIFKKVGNVMTRVATHKARVFRIGNAGDSLWFVRGSKKYIAPAVIQSAPNEFWHEEREDGEWINFSMTSVNDEQKKAGVKFIHQDMRSQRIATANILEQRLMARGFWEKWGVVIGYVIFFLVITVAVTLNLYMMGKVVKDLSPLVNAITTAVEELRANCIPDNSIVPALLPLVFFWRKK